ncbi:glutamate ligase domain-containing protein [Tsuneonella sp. HG249]
MVSPLDLATQPWFFCGIGGSGMLPLAQIVHGLGGQVAGSDRSRDQGRTAEKFAWLERNGFELFPQDGSGVTSPNQIVVASAAIESTVPEIIRAGQLGCPRMTRAQLNSALFNAADTSVAIAGTSGKSTVTAMLGWILHDTGRAPTIMNGAVMKNFASPENPFASAKVGQRDLYVSEVDESDGSIALYRPKVGVLLNVSLDHKSMNELRLLFADFLRATNSAAVNLDDPEVAELSAGLAGLSFGFDALDAQLSVLRDSIVDAPTSIAATVVDRRDGSHHPLAVAMPGMHNLSNALAAIAGASLTGVSVADATRALANFAGLARRFDILGTSPSGVSVIDDFGHNPEKCAATLRALKRHPGRVLAFFQPHGFGPLRQMGRELAHTFSRELGPDDLTLICDPLYFGGTVERNDCAFQIAEKIRDMGGCAEHFADREEVADRIEALARPGDRIAVMGARDDTLTEFSRNLLLRLP